MNIPPPSQQLSTTFFSLLSLLQSLSEEQITSIGFTKQTLHLQQLHSLISSFPELLSLDPLSLSLSPPPTIRNHSFSPSELSPFRSLIFLLDLQSVILHQTTPTHITALSSALSTPLLSETNRFDLLRQFCGCIALIPPSHLSNIHQNRHQLHIAGVLKEIGIEENHPFFVPLINSLFSLSENDFLSLCSSLLTMGPRHLLTLAKLFAVPLTTYHTTRLLLSTTPPSSSLSSSSPSLPSLRIELKIFPNINKAFLTKRPLPNPKPSLQLSGDDTALDPRSLLVCVTLINFYTNKEVGEEGGGGGGGGGSGKGGGGGGRKRVAPLSHDCPLPIVSGQCVSFPKLTINKTSKACDDCMFCFQFELRYYQNPSSSSSTTTSTSPYQTLHTIRSPAFRTISHAESLPTTPFSINTTPIPPPTLFEIIPETTNDTGTHKIAILGHNFINQSTTLKVSFGGTLGVPQYFSPHTLLCFPPRSPPGGVEVAVSNDGIQWSNSLSFVFHCHLPEGVAEGGGGGWEGEWEGGWGEEDEGGGEYGLDLGGVF